MNHFNLVLKRMYQIVKDFPEKDISLFVHLSLSCKLKVALSLAGKIPERFFVVISHKQKYLLYVQIIIVHFIVHLELKLISYVIDREPKSDRLSFLPI